MFASAGTLDSEDVTESFTDHREDILQLTQVLVGDVQALLGASTGTKQELINAGETAHNNVTQLVEKIKSAATSLGSSNQETQVMLLNSARDVCSSLHGLLVHAKTANGQDVDHPAYEQVSDYSRVSESERKESLLSYLAAGSHTEHYQLPQVRQVLRGREHAGHQGGGELYRGHQQRDPGVLQ